MLSVHRPLPSPTQDYMQDDTDAYSRRGERMRFEDMGNEMHGFPPPPNSTFPSSMNGLGAGGGYGAQGGGHQSYATGPFRSSHLSFPDHHHLPSPHSTLANSSYLPEPGLGSLHYPPPLTIPDSRVDHHHAHSHAHSHSHSHQSHSQSPDVGSPVSLGGGPSSAGHGHPSMPLAPDQPPTTQGKPRTRVYVACLQCRSRKIRCDGAKPTCHNCTRRSSECKYDAVPKRRGPDKKPGARQRTVKKKDPEDPNSPSQAVKPKKRRKSEADATPIKHELSGPGDAALLSPTSPSDLVRPGIPGPGGVDLSRPMYITPPIPPLAEMDPRQDRARYQFAHSNQYYMD